MRSADFMGSALCDDLSGAVGTALAVGADTVELARSTRNSSAQVIDLMARPGGHGGPDSPLMIADRLHQPDPQEEQ
ncbi:hypothetical protein GTZ78_33125 [Streptomyces sp. SID8361]|uniref:hypothetical protein n=1 Tax=Streptomyces TaxID=1883 RepID=UPI000B87A775|nr:hypothetical protein [Streptomyces sp. MnatMP-M27]MYU15398.1 hypothetical protein [Streptomyces sp. SID8361]